MDRNLKLNKDAMPNSGLSYVLEPSVVESDLGKRLVFAIRSRLENEPPEGLVAYLDVTSSDNFSVRSHVLDSLDSLKFYDEMGVGEFTSRGQRYRIRALQESDKSWVSGLEFTEDNEIKG